MPDEDDKKWPVTTSEAVANVASTAASSFQINDFTVGEAANNLSRSLTANFSIASSAASVSDQQVEDVKTDTEVFEAAVASSDRAPQTEIFKLK